MTSATAAPPTAPNLALHEHGLEWRRIAGREVANLSGLALVVSAPHPGGGFSFGVVEPGPDGAMVVRREGRAETRANARRDAVLAAGDVLGLVGHEVAQALAVTDMTPAVGGRVRTAAYVLLAVIGVCAAAAVAAVVVMTARSILQVLG